MSERYAIYYTLPKENELYQKVSSWLGHDVYGTKEKQNSFEFPEALVPFRQYNNKASVYGFHATLKAPFRLAEGLSRHQLEYSLEKFCTLRKPFECGKMSIVEIGNFLAFSHQSYCQKMELLAQDCVKTFEDFRAPLNNAEIARRKPESLTKKQKQLLNLWGYPYVMEEFKFHMTLTNKIYDGNLQACHAALNDYFSPYLSQSFVVDRVYLYHQPSPTEKFYIINSFPFENID